MASAEVTPLPDDERAFWEWMRAVAPPQPNYFYDLPEELRRKIEADSRNPYFIQTVRGGGYRFGADVTRTARSDAS